MTQHLLRRDMQPMLPHASSYNADEGGIIHYTERQSQMCDYMLVSCFIAHDGNISITGKHTQAARHTYNTELLYYMLITGFLTLLLLLPWHTSSTAHDLVITSAQHYDCHQALRAAGR